MQALHKELYFFCPDYICFHVKIFIVAIKVVVTMAGNFVSHFFYFYAPCNFAVGALQYGIL